MFITLPVVLRCVTALTASAASVDQQALQFSAIAGCPAPTLKAEKTYAGIVYNKGTVSRLRIGNGGAGQSGLVGALAQTFIDYSRKNGIAKEDYLVDWVLGDTTQSIDNLENGNADIAITYNAAAEYRAGNLSISKKRIYGFRDHFYLVGPKSNPAGLRSDDKVSSMMNKIVTTGNAGNGDPPTRFLSRFDKSATNIKESLLFAEIGQIPWAYTYSTWYHQYPRFPLAALSAASLLQEYTLTDRGTFLTLSSTNKTLASQLVVYGAGADTDPQDPLLNPAAVLLGSKVCSENLALAEAFVKWMAESDGGQSVVKNFKQPGSNENLYTGAPDCKVDPKACYGW